MRGLCEVHRLGLVPYDEARALQERFAAERAAEARPDSLILLQHPHTYTLGRSGRAEHLLLSEAELARRGVAVHWVDRGGDITYHGPGQLVGYPILGLGRPVDDNGHLPQADYVGYVRRLEAVIIRALARFGVVGGQLTGLTGVWVQPDVASRCLHCPPAARKLPSKIASIGVKVDGKGVTRHGFAVNVAPDMSYFDGIVACGLHDAPAIAMADMLGDEPPMAAVMDAVADAFGREFDCQVVNVGDYTESPLSTLASGHLRIATE